MFGYALLALSIFQAFTSNGTPSITNTNIMVIGAAICFSLGYVSDTIKENKS